MNLYQQLDAKWIFPIDVDFFSKENNGWHFWLISQGSKFTDQKSMIGSNHRSKNKKGVGTFFKIETPSFDML